MDEMHQSKNIELLMDKRAWPTHMLPTRDTPQDTRPTQTKSEGVETHFPSKWTVKQGWGSNTHIRQNRLPKKGHKERPRRSLHNTQRKKPPRRHKHYKYICTQHRSTQIPKDNLGGLQERYSQHHNYSRGFSHPTVKDGQIFQTKHQQRYCGIEQFPRWNALNWYI